MITLGKISSNSPERILIKIHITRKLLEMELQVAVAVLVLPWVHATTFILHDWEIIRCCDVAVHGLKAK